MWAIFVPQRLGPHFLPFHAALSSTVIYYYFHLCHYYSLVEITTVNNNNNNEEVMFYETKAATITITGVNQPSVPAVRSR